MDTKHYRKMVDEYLSKYNRYRVSSASDENFNFYQMSIDFETAAKIIKSCNEIDRQVAIQQLNE